MMSEDNDKVVLVTAPGNDSSEGNIGEKELELHAQVSFEKPKQFSGNFHNVQMHKDEEYHKSRAFFGMDENAEHSTGIAVTGRSGGTASAVSGGGGIKPFTFTNYMKDSSTFLRFTDTAKSAKGFLDTLINQKKDSLSTGAKNVYKLGLLIFFAINLLYPIIVFAVNPEYVPYNVICGVISFVGFIYECIQIVPEIYKLIKNRQEAAIQEIDNNDGSYKGKVLKVLKEFVIDSFGEILIYPSIICGLYGFINERGWEFNTTLSIFDFLLLLYTFVIDAFYAKLYHIWLVKRLVSASYAAHDKHENINTKWWKDRCLTPLSLTIPNSCILAVMHWLMLAIIGV